ncbi:MAG: DUF3795 domain-containing protein [Deltaproteobacteria bacterium]
MDHGNIINRLAPCGLDCGRCAGYSGGKIKCLSGELAVALGHYRRIAPVRARADGEFAYYEQFEKILAAFAASDCNGCRSEGSRCPAICKAKKCHKEKGVDFCFQCSDFPCDDEMEVVTGGRWRKFNERMAEIGVEAFYEEQLGMPRYGPL